MSERINVAVDSLEQLVIFTLSQESYGVDIGKVNGIERMQAITRVPRTPEYVEGVINLRGRVIPVVDMRKVFLLPATEETKDTRIVVMDISGQQIGMIVDEVTEVLRIPADSVEPPSSIITSAAESSYLLGIAKLQDRMITLLDMDKALSGEHATGLGEVSAAVEEAPCLETESDKEEAGEEVMSEDVEEISEKTKKTSKSRKTKGKTLAKASK